MFCVTIRAAVTIYDVFSVITSHEFTRLQKVKILSAYVQNSSVKMDRQYIFKKTFSERKYRITERFSALGLALYRGFQENSIELVEVLFPVCDLEKKAIDNLTIEEFLDHLEQQPEFMQADPRASAYEESTQETHV